MKIREVTDHSIGHDRDVVAKQKNLEPRQSSHKSAFRMGKRQTQTKAQGLWRTWCSILNGQEASGGELCSLSYSMDTCHARLPIMIVHYSSLAAEWTVRRDSLADRITNRLDAC